VFPQLSTGTMSDEPGLLITSSNGTPFQEVLPASLENPALTATGYVRAPAVAPEIRANLREVGIIQTSPGSESLDQDSTIIIPGVKPPSPSRWKCDPHADTLPMSHTPQPQVQTLNARVLTRDHTPPTPTPPRHHHQRSEALTIFSEVHVTTPELPRREGRPPSPTTPVPLRPKLVSLRFFQAGYGPGAWSYLLSESQLERRCLFS